MARRQREIGFVFQDATLLPWRTALDNVQLPLQVGRGPRAGGRAPGNCWPWSAWPAGRARCRTSCPAACASACRSPARCCAARKILLMDEPFGALDEITRDRLNEELLRIWRETGTTILFVTHSIHEAVFLGQRVLVLAANPGRVREMVPVALPEPRALAIRDTAGFAALAGRLRAVLETC